jgi:hypothetical protein
MIILMPPPSGGKGDWFNSQHIQAIPMANRVANTTATTWSLVPECFALSIRNSYEYAQTFRGSGIFWGILLNFQVFFSLYRSPSYGFCRAGANACVDCASLSTNVQLVQSAIAFIVH